MNWREKARIVRLFLAKTGVSPKEILGPYEGKNFKDGVSKIGVLKGMLSGTPTEEVCNYIINRTSGSGLSHQRDHRDPIEYGSNLVFGWLMEDWVAIFLKKSGFCIALSGCDSDREFLSRYKVKTDADIDVLLGPHKRKVELVFDYGSHWIRKDQLDLRDKKFKKIQDAQALVLGISTIDKKGFVYCPSLDAKLEVKYSKSHGPFGKAAYSVMGIKTLMVPLEKLSGVLESKILSGNPEEVAV